MSSAEMRIETSGIAPELRDGFEVHAAALRHGLDVALYPRQVLMARPRQGDEELAFVHGLPESAGLGPVTYAQDKRMRRALFEAAGLPIPRGVTFSVGHGVAGAKRFAAKVGYPVVVKPAIGDNAIETFADLRDDEMFDAAIEKLRVAPSERETFTRAAYGLTELREPGEEDGRMVVPPGYRFLVEDHVHGTYLRTLVMYGAVRSAILCPGSPAIGTIDGGEEVLDQVHPTVLRMAARAVSAVPGIPVAAVDFVMADHRKNADDQDLWIVEFSERPGLAVQAAVSEALSANLADTLLREHARRTKVHLVKPDNNVIRHWQAESIPDPSRALDAIQEFASSVGLTFDAQPVDHVEGVVAGAVEGSAGLIAYMSEMLLDGRLHGHRAMFIKTTHE